MNKEDKIHICNVTFFKNLNEPNKDENIYYIPERKNDSTVYPVTTTEDDEEEEEEERPSTASTRKVCNNLI